jgi:hypothetical protein
MSKSMAQKANKLLSQKKNPEINIMNLFFQKELYAPCRNQSANDKNIFIKYHRQDMDARLLSLASINLGDHANFILAYKA